MIVILNFYKNLNKEFKKFSNTIVHIISPKRKKRKFSNLSSYLKEKDSTFEDWKKIENDYLKIGNDIRKIIKTNVKY